MDHIRGIVIVGAGQAGASAAAKLRTEGFDGQITLIGEEPVLPYQRPPLSKAYLMGKLEVERLHLQPQAFYENARIDLELGKRAVTIDRKAHTIRLSDGRDIGWDRLLLTTGATPRQLPQPPMVDAVKDHVIRTVADVDRLTTSLDQSNDALVVGGGYIGLEAAAVLRHLGLTVTVVEAAERILQRVACEATADRMAELHRSNGVDIRVGCGLDELSPRSDGRVNARLSDGSELAVDIIVIGIGVVPNVELAEQAGLEISNGIAVDEHCQTSDPNIYAAGDCTSFPWRGRRIRLESVQNAIDQAEAAAINMLGAAGAYQPVPWFWSDQYDLKLQIAGLSQGYSQTIERPGNREGAHSIWYYRDDELLAVDAFNDGAAFMTAKRMLQSGQSPSPDKVADPGVPLKSFLSST